MADRTVGWVELKFGSWDACNPFLHALVLPCLSLGAFFPVMVALVNKEGFRLFLNVSEGLATSSEAPSQILILSGHKCPIA